MTGSNRRPMHRRERPIAIAAGFVGVTSALAISFVAVALASGTVTIGSQPNSKLGKRVAANAQGHTLYALGGESRSHQFCTSSECLRFWPPVRASSKSTHLKAGSGVRGQLRVLTRSGAIVQVMLRGQPLYRYAGDKARGEANGEGIVGPGGHVWHAVGAASSTTQTVPAPPPPMPNPSPPSPPPSYPAPANGY